MEIDHQRFVSKIFLIGSLLLLFAGVKAAFAEVTVSLYSSENCNQTNNTHVFFASDSNNKTVLVQGILTPDMKQTNSVWEIQKSNGDLKYLKNKDDPSLLRTIEMNKKGMYIVEQRRNGVLEIKGGVLQIGSSKGEKVVRFYQCSQSTPAGAEGIARFQAMKKQLDANSSKRNAQPQSDSGPFSVSARLNQIKKQCEQFPQAKQRCATASNYSQCMKILLPDLGADNFDCLTLFPR